jgi:hypothetical protein
MIVLSDCIAVEKKRPAKKQASYGTLGGTIQYRVFKGYNILNQHSGLLPAQYY